MGTGKGNGLDFGRTRGSRDDERADRKAGRKKDTARKRGKETSEEHAVQERESRGRRRGTREPHSNALPNYDDAVIPEEKVFDYALNPNHARGRDKARVFESALGFTREDSYELIRQIREELPYHEAILGELDRYGQRFSVSLPILGNNGLVKVVRTGWIIRSGELLPRLTTVLVC